MSIVLALCLLIGATACNKSEHLPLRHLLRLLRLLKLPGSCVLLRLLRRRAPVSLQKTGICAPWTSDATGAYTIIGNAWEGVLKEHLPNVSFNCEITAGSAANAELMATGDLDMAMISASVLGPAVWGDDDKWKEPTPMLACFAFNAGYAHLLARVGSGIKTLDDIKGKRVNTLEPGGGGDIFCNLAFKAWGWDIEKDIVRQRITWADAAEAIADSRCDFSFQMTPYPNGSINDALNASKCVELIDFSDEMIQKCVDSSPLVAATVIPSAYGIRDYPTLLWTNCFAVHADADEELVYSIVKTLFDNIDEWKDAHGSTKTWSVQQAVVGVPIDFHPGAIRYYKEIGVWKE